jgi:prophage regulatory protein
MARTKPQRNIIRKPAVRVRTGLSESQLWCLEQRREFPSRVQIGPMAVGWYEDEIDDWVESRARASGPQPPLPKSRRQAQPPIDDDRARRKTNNRGQIADR